MINIEELKFDEKGLIPAIVVDAVSKKVLTLAYMNRESLAISMEKELTCFFSRSRQELWLKGATSGNYQHIVSITADCDYDALEVRVKKDGPACHTGAESCFHNDIWGEKQEPFRLEGLYDLLLSRIVVIVAIQLIKAGIVTNGFSVDVNFLTGHRTLQNGSIVRVELNRLQIITAIEGECAYLHNLVRNS